MIDFSRTASMASYPQLYTIEYNLSKLFELQFKQEIFFSKQDMDCYLGVTARSLGRVLKADIGS